MTIHMRKSAWPLMTEKYSKVCDLSRTLTIQRAEKGAGLTTVAELADVILVELLLLNDFEPKDRFSKSNS